MWGGSVLERMLKGWVMIIMGVIGKGEIEKEIDEEEGGDDEASFEKKREEIGDFDGGED